MMMMMMMLTWRGPDAQVTAEVVLQRGQHGSHLLLHLIQADDVLHQGGVDAHFTRLALRFRFREGWVEKAGDERWGGKRRESLKLHIFLLEK